MTRKHLRSRKELHSYVEDVLAKDKEAMDIIADLGTSMLTVCQKGGVEPESMLYQLILLTKISQDEMMRKYAARFQNLGDRPWTKRQKEMIRDDHDRLWDILSERCVNALQEADWIIKHLKTESKDTDEKRNGDDRPFYIN